MGNLYNNDSELLDTNEFELISKQGSECNVYKYGNLAVKLFKENYPYEHFSYSEIKFLRQIPTKRILLPADVVFDDWGQIKGYIMPYIGGKKSFLKEKMQHIINEMLVLKKDLDMLFELDICLIDVHEENVIYNGGLYIVDPGNFKIGDVSIARAILDPRGLCMDDKIILKRWNIREINNMLFYMIFGYLQTINFALYSKIIHFFEEERKAKGVLYDAEIYKQYFNLELSVEDATQEFIEKYIKPISDCFLKKNEHNVRFLFI